MNLLAELRRRNVIRMAGLYIVGAWLVVQVAATVLPAFAIPDWVLRATIILLAIGFIPALVFSWVFELTPDGLRRESEITPAEDKVVHTARKLDVAVILLLLGVGALTLWRPDFGKPDPGKVGSESTLDPAAQAIRTAPAPKVDSDPSSEAGPSIAVLPFLNMSPDADNAYFADGISEELLNVLARVEGLKVASRTSSFTFKGQSTPIPEIARLLGVRHVLEGSVRKQGQRVRITAQLIHAGDDGHLWSQTYDRELTDIFAVQQEIAEAIAGELGGLLGTAGIAVDAPTANMAAYERFLRGRARFHQRAELVDALADLEFAVQQDPQFADAWIYLAATNHVFPGYSDALPRAQTQAAAAAAVLRAQALGSDDPMLLAVQGQMAANEARLVASLDLLEQASRLSEHDSTPVLWLGMNLMFAGYVDEAIEVLERAVRMDPLVGINNGALSYAYFYAGEYERGVASARIGANGGWPAGLALQMIELSARGDRAQAADLIAGDLASFLFPPDTPRALREAFIAAVRDPTMFETWLGLQTEDPAQARFPPERMLAMDQIDPLLDWFTPERLARDRHMWMLRPFWLPSTSALREDPRFIPIAEAFGLIELWEQRGYPRGCRPVDGPDGHHLECLDRR